jgi:hypothetical protein
VLQTKSGPGGSDQKKFGLLIDLSRQRVKPEKIFESNRRDGLILKLSKNGLKDMGQRGWKLGIGVLLCVGVFSGGGFFAYGEEGNPVPEHRPGPGKTFLYTARKFGVPILKASIKIENGSSEQGIPVYRIDASVSSLPFGFLFRMNNRFISTVQAETCSPVRYVKEIDQEGLLVAKKNYLQTFTFDFSHKRVVVEKGEKTERQEIPLSSETYDPLSMFAKCYLKEEIQPGQSIPMSIFDGVKLREMVFYSKKEKVKSTLYGEVDAVCLESSTSFSTFGDKEGKIRIWYTADGRKTPILMELELPIGHIKFELESMEKS